MFSGKTWQLITEVMRYRDLGYKTCVINHSADVRSTTGSAGNLTYHIGCDVKLPVDITMISCSGLDDLNLEEYKCIAIDEAQFFSTLDRCVKLLDEGKHMIISCLNGSSDRKPMGDIPKLLPHCNDIKLRRSYCLRCRREKGHLEDAIYTKCKIVKKEEVTIGGSDIYEPVCRKCYHN
jgi:thymidine kinase